MSVPKNAPSCLHKGRSPKGYDLAMEVLATLPLHGDAPLAVLATDFRLPQYEMAGLLENLARRFGLRLNRRVRGNVESVSVFPDSRPFIDARSLDYWERTYEE